MYSSLFAASLTATGTHVPRVITHSVTCHPADVIFPPSPQRQLVLVLATSEGCKAELTLLRESGPTGHRIHDLLVTSPKPYCYTLTAKRIYHRMLGKLLTGRLNEGFKYTRGLGHLRLIHANVYFVNINLTRFSLYITTL